MILLIYDPPSNFLVTQLARLAADNCIVIVAGAPAAVPATPHDPVITRNLLQTIITPAVHHRTISRPFALAIRLWPEVAPQAVPHPRGIDQWEYG